MNRSFSPLGYLCLLLIICTLENPGMMDLCRAESQIIDQAELRIFVSVAPQKYFVERLIRGVSSAQINIMVKPGQSPAVYEPSPNQIAALGNADVFFTIGVPFEKPLLKRISRLYPSLRIVNTGDTVQKRMIANHGHGHGHDHGHDELMDPHIWLSPPLIIEQVTVISTALKSLDPDRHDVIETNRRKFADELTRIHQKLTAQLKPYSGRSFYIFHPSLGYFADTYKLVQKAVESGGKAPTPRRLAAIIREARKEGIKAILVQTEFDRRNAMAIAEAIDGTIVSIEPLAEDVMNNLDRIGKTLTAIFEGTVVEKGD
jgi:zinc transport system substrate-binding protein